MSKNANVKVFCRIRPENEQERMNGLNSVLQPISTSSVRVLSSLPLEFTFDGVFGERTTQKYIFETVALPVISSAFEGMSGTLFCYGQTSSGKTFTMEGQRDDEELMGIIPRMMEFVFDFISKANSEIEYSVKCQYYQIYNEKIQDLLDPRKTDLAIREDKNKGIWVEDCTEAYVSSMAEMYSVFLSGSGNRTVAATKMNRGSSRSHSLFSVTIFQRNTITGSSKTGRIYFVDLAGSEKMSKTGIEGGKGLKEAQNINKSLMTLGMVINALTEGAKHVPYRDSKLTRVLQESLGGNSLTNLIITCSPNAINEAESISTLRFGQRAKLIKNKVIANTQQSAKELLMKLKIAEEKIKRLEQIIKQGGGSLQNVSSDNTSSNTNNSEECTECKKYLSQFSLYQAENLALQSENEELTEKNKELQEEIKEKNKEIFELNGKVMELENELEDFKKEQKIAYDDILKCWNEVKIMRFESFSLSQNKNLKKITENSKKFFNLFSDLMKNLGIVQKIEDSEDEGLIFENLLNKSCSFDHGSFDEGESQDICENKDKLNNSFTYKGIKISTLKAYNLSRKQQQNNDIHKTSHKSLTAKKHKRSQSVLCTPNKNETIEFNPSKEFNTNLVRVEENNIINDTDNSPIIDNLNKEIENLNKKVNDYEDAIKNLNEKLIKKEKDLEDFKHQNLKDISIKEQKMVNLVNRIADLEDENYKLTHFTKDNIDKKKMLIMEKQINSFAKEMQKMMEKNNDLTKKLKENENKLKSLNIENKKLKENYEFLERNYTNTTMSNINNNNQYYHHINKQYSGNLGGYNICDESRYSIYEPLESTTNRYDLRKNSNSPSIMGDYGYGDMTNRFQTNRMMKVIKGGTKSNGGFFSKMMGNNDNKIEPFKILNKFGGKNNNENFKQKMFENEMKMLENDLFNDAASEMP